MNFWAIFLTGLTTGGLSCLAMQGGLLASVIVNGKESASQDDANKKIIDANDVLPVGMFIVAKLISHVLLGLLLGWFGSKIELSLTTRLVFQGLAAIFMIATAANLLNLHPIFRYVVIQPPKLLRKMVRRTSRSETFFAPASLGFLTVLIPCGVTQAVEVLAITSANPIVGALIMGVFVLGTMPLFTMVGVATAKLSGTFTKNFQIIAAILLTYLAIYSLNGILVVVDSPFSINRIIATTKKHITKEPKIENSASYGNFARGAQQINIQVVARGYSPNYFVVKAGVPVQLNLQSKDVYTCASSFVFREFGIGLQLAPTDSQSVMFTPTKKGVYQFSCSMGMYTGTMEVI